jgi:hypothetical protein
MMPPIDGADQNTAGQPEDSQANLEMGCARVLLRRAATSWPDLSADMMMESADGTVWLTQLEEQFASVRRFRPVGGTVPVPR